MTTRLPSRMNGHAEGPVAEIDLDYSPEVLEDQFGEEGDEIEFQEASDDDAEEGEAEDDDEDLDDL